MIDIVLVSVGSPVVFGFYRDLELYVSYSADSAVGDFLPMFFSAVFGYGGRSSFPDFFHSLGLDHVLSVCADLKRELSGITRIFYCRGVGSLVAMKLTHIFLQGLSLCRNISLHATNCFYFVRGTDVVDMELIAFNNMSFFIDSGRRRHYSSTDDAGSVILDGKRYSVYVAESINPSETLTLPRFLSTSDFCEPCLPIYITPFA